MVSGVVCILPPHFEEIFGDSAVYAKPKQVAGILQDLSENPTEYRRLAMHARKSAEEKYDASTFAPRVSKLMRNPPINAPRSPQIARPLPKRNICFLSSNGIGMGHLTQQLAIADRLPDDLQPVFSTMSYSRPVLDMAGYPSDFLPHHYNGNMDPERWNHALAEHLFEFFAHTQPSVICYDSTAVFGGAVKAIKSWGRAFSIWVRRPMWQHSHTDFAQHLNDFDAVLEPEELAAELDYGATVQQQESALVSEPVLHIVPDARLSRQDARHALDLPQDQMIVALQIGPGTNFNLAKTRDAALDYLLSRPDVTVLELLSPIQSGPPPAKRPHARHLQQTLFPTFQYSNAFDAAIVNAGYNAFHENVFGAIPSLFVPNEGPYMDMQVNRALWAEMNGVGMLHRKYHDATKLKQQLEQLLNEAFRSRLIDRCRDLKYENGAQVFADFVSDHARLVRADRSHAIVI